MRILHWMVAQSRALFRSGRVDADLADEMRFHVEREIEANLARGMSPHAARRAARLTFGSVDAMHEQSRDERPGAGIREMARDVRFGARLFRKSPGFAITCRRGHRARHRHRRPRSSASFTASCFARSRTASRSASSASGS
jgi:hypothetical protein